MKKKRLFISITAVLVLTLVIGLFWYTHPTHYLFNDRFILGSTPERIVEKYGAFEKTSRNPQGDITRGVYKIWEDTPELIMSYDDSLWYEIYFENGIAVSVRLQEGWYGG